MIIRRIAAFAAFLYEFIVGDDWRVAVGIVVGLGLTYVVSKTTSPAWWIMPVTTALLLVLSVRRETHQDP